MQRDFSISFLRVTAMIIIVFYHCCCFNVGIWDFCETVSYSKPIVGLIKNLAYVGLFTFVFISGMLYHRISTRTQKYDNTFLFLKNKVCRLLLPYCIWTFILCVLLPFRYNITTFYRTSSHLWFLIMLFNIFVLACLTKKLWRNFSKKACVVLFLLLLIIDIISAKFSVFQFFGLQSALHYLPVFFLGMMSDKFKTTKYFFSGQFFSLGAVILFIVGSLCFDFHIHGLKLVQWIPTYALVFGTYNYLTSRKYFNGGV